MTRAQKLFDALSTFGAMDCRQASQVLHDDLAGCSSMLSDMRRRGILIVAGYRRYPDSKSPLVRYALAPGATRPATHRQAPMLPLAPVVLRRVETVRVPEHQARQPVADAGDWERGA
jgi:hypothetical protein